MVPSRRARSVVVAALCLTACGGTGSPPDGQDGGTGGKRGSDGGSGGASGSTADGFAGSWTFAQGTVTPACMSINVGLIDLTSGKVTITRTDASHLVFALTSTELTCNLNFTYSGSTATVASGQTCALKALGLTATVKVTTWTLTLSGSSIAMKMSGTAMVSVVSCMPTGDGMLSRTN
jgi:hypothetical protein